MASADYWLVGNTASGTEGGASKIVISATKPAGYSYVAQVGSVGQDLKTVEAGIAQGIFNLPTGIAAEKSYKIPGLGTFTNPGPGGIAGTLDNGATTAGNAIQSFADAEQQVLNFLSSERGWIRVLEYVGGAALIFLAIKAAAEQH